MGCWRAAPKAPARGWSARFRSRPRLPSASSSRGPVASRCAQSETSATPNLTRSSPRRHQVRIAPDRDAVAIRAGVIGGMATALLPGELRTAAAESGATFENLLLIDGDRELRLVGHASRPEPNVRFSEWPLQWDLGGAGRQHSANAHHARSAGFAPSSPMWIAAALITWLLVSRLLVRPLRRLERAVRGYRPGQSSLDLPRKLGPAQEIQELRDAFARAVTRVDESEREMTGALEGQRRWFAKSITG